MYLELNSINSKSIFKILVLDASTNGNIPEDKAVDQDESIKARSKSIEDNLQHVRRYLL